MDTEAKQKLYNRSSSLAPILRAALEQAGDEPNPRIHLGTLLPGHFALPQSAEVLPMCPEQTVAHVSEWHLYVVATRIEAIPQLPAGSAAGMQP